MSINVSTSDLLEADFSATSRTARKRHELPGEAIVIEITETTIITDFLRSQAVILQFATWDRRVDRRLRRRFHLSRLPQQPGGRRTQTRPTFITSLSAEGNGREMELVRATINLGHDMGLRVVAEGIEDVETLDLLGDLGCDLAQGYFISRPSPASRLSFQPNETRELTGPVS